MVNSCFSVVVFCVCASIFAVLLRRYCTEQSLMIAIAACAVVMIGFVTMVQPIIT
ncbi:MAG: hypothetical protein LUG26_06050 [Ruminococcus sp.]|nr:hypothetical protein [Ruminococcus sp.]